MAKISPVSIKYMIHATLNAEGTLEKPDVIGALFGQTEGLLGADLEMRELQKEGKIGRIEVELEKQGKNTVGKIKIPTALDQSETTLIAAAIETIERVGPCDAQIEVDRIEDVRGSKRDYILERAKKLISQIEGSTNSRDISNEIKDSTKSSEIIEYGASKLASGDLSGKEIIVVEGRADVVNLVKNGVNNVICMNGTKLPEEIKELSKEKEIILFVDGDRGGKLIAQNVMENATVKYIASAPDGKEVEELTKKEILMNLRKKVPAKEFFYENKRSSRREEPSSFFELDEEKKKTLKEMANKNKKSGDALILNTKLEIIKKASAKSLSSSLKRMRDKPVAIIIDGSATKPIIFSCEDVGVKVLVANSFTTTDTKIKLLSF
ncbi:MAG: DNA primase [Nanoarchaeota archaeon]|nr:DNA primase [Nanoarchaeota archaeon]